MCVITTEVEVAVRALKEGRVVALPTETVYGLAASINQEEALKQIFSLKKRPADNPLIVHALDLEMIEQFAELSDDFLKLYEAFMPGPLTVLLKKKKVSDLVTCGLETVAVRVPSHPLFRAVLKQLAEPLAAPSANLSGTPSSTQARHVYKDFAADLSIILDGGGCECGIESTIIRLFEDHGLILRPGVIEKKQLEELLNKPFYYASEKTPHQAPGMKYRHYAPKAKLILVSSFDKELLHDPKVMILSQLPQDCPHYQELSEENFYSALRYADERGLESIYALVTGPLSEGLRNRLEKAALIDMRKF